MIDKIFNYINLICSSLPLVLILYLLLNDSIYGIYILGAICFTIYILILHYTLKENIKEFHNLSQEEKDKIIFEWTLETS